MRNKEFWLSISNIIDGDFKPEGLAKLEEYAEWFISGKLVYERFSSAEQFGCINGGAIHVIASILAGAEVKADSLASPVGSIKREFECAETQAKRIERWARTIALRRSTVAPFVSNGVIELRQYRGWNFAKPVT